LVHRIDARKINYAEEQKTGSKGNTPVALSCFVDLLFSNAGVLDSLVNLLCKLFAVLKLIDQRLIKEKLSHTSVALGQALQDVVLNVQ
jgi:hypothetical protein